MSEFSRSTGGPHNGRAGTKPEELRAVATYKRLGDLLVDAGMISEDQLSQALAMQKSDTQRRRLGDLLISEGFITENDLIEALRMQLGIDFIDLTNYHIPPELSRTLSKNIARTYSVVPIKETPDEVYLAMADPLNFMAVEAVKTAVRKQVVPVLATSNAIQRAIMTLYGNEGAARAIEDMKRTQRGTVTEVEDDVNEIDEDSEANAAPTIRLVNNILERGMVERASDIHLEPREEELFVRMRIDGVLRTILTVPGDLQNSVISRLKIMGNMNVSERRVPQDGRAVVRIRQKDIDLRISTLPTVYGETVVIRLLDRDANLFDAETIGLRGGALDAYKRAIRASSGMILIVGPTGSGKSSTMSTIIRELNKETVNLVTLEDPVEYSVDGVNQVQINEKTGMTFASGLRAILRQDPDIISVGEIRDGETAEIAIRAAITGHLVLSTIHTNDAVSTVDRLSDIGVEPYLIASGLNAVISQRLVRRVCPHCRREYEATPEELELLGLPAVNPATGKPFMLYKGEGCPECFNAGYRGRIGVFEVFTMDRTLRQAVTEGARREQLLTLVEKQPEYKSLAQNAIELVLDGTTTVEEALKVIHSMGW